MNEKKVNRKGNHAVPLSKLDKNNNNNKHLSGSMCSTHHQHILSFQSNNQKKSMHQYHSIQSPIVKLKEKIENLKKTNIESQSIIECQQKEIERLRARQSRISMNPIQQIETLIERAQMDYQNQLADLKKAIEEKEKSVFQKQALYEALKENHRRELSQRDLDHQNYLTLLETQHSIELYQRRSSLPGLANLLEKVLIDFEQEQHTIPSDQKLPFYLSPSKKTPLTCNVNQQWYIKKYMPVDAHSWPFPHHISHHHPTKSRLGI
ncbi:hypothetical protein BY458DRAFT_529674 [Sporodiniella umbellata]|nr:hypothetical protein BY458DRAFT_529674 [Sporodiniella umbellata]